MAVGMLGLSLSDFASLTPDEFNHIWQAYMDKKTARQQESWEQVRMLATYILMPHSSKQINPSEVMHFEWDDTQIRSSPRKKMTHQEFKNLVEKIE